MVYQPFSEKNTVKTTGQTDCHETWGCICQSGHSPIVKSKNHIISFQDSVLGMRGFRGIRNGTKHWPFLPNYDICCIINQNEMHRNNVWYHGYLPQALITDNRSSKEKEFSSCKCPDLYWIRVYAYQIFALTVVLTVLLQNKAIHE